MTPSPQELALSRRLETLGATAVWIDQPKGLGAAILVALGSTTLSAHRPTKRQCAETMIEQLEGCCENQKP